MSNKSDIAIKKFNDGYNCSQSVVYSFCDELEIDKDTALKLASPFGAGMGRMQEVCGAVTGGLMVLGKKYGRGENEDRSATENVYKKTMEFMHSFKKKHGSFICKKLLNGCELSKENGHKYFQENDLRNKVCLECVKNAVELLEK